MDAFLTSVTRISDLHKGDFEIRELPRSSWADADYVVTRVIDASSDLNRLELANGRIVEAMEGARVVGAFGKRAATLEAVGDWEAIPDDGAMHALTGAGLFGQATSVAPRLPRLMGLSYEGHAIRNDAKLTMSDFLRPVSESKFAMPVILLVGTSMSAGKTTTGRFIIHELKRLGLRVAGAKFTGAGRYRDILAFQDAGADEIVDFVDAGLPSTVVSAERFQLAMDYMLARVAETDADVLVAEAGASPLEPYNGDIAVASLRDNVCCTVLCASDPYAVVGVHTAFRLKPDLVTGPAANTEAGIELVKKLTELPALNLFQESSRPRLLEVLESRLARP